MGVGLAVAHPAKASEATSANAEIIFMATSIVC
jgi:hypothetical protein